MARADELRWLVEWDGMYLKAFDPKTLSLTWTKHRDQGGKLKLVQAKELVKRLRADRYQEYTVTEID